MLKQTSKILTNLFLSCTCFIAFVYSDRLNGEFQLIMDCEFGYSAYTLGHNYAGNIVLGVPDCCQLLNTDNR